MHDRSRKRILDSLCTQRLSLLQTKQTELASSKTLIRKVLIVGTYIDNLGPSVAFLLGEFRAP